MVETILRKIQSRPLRFKFLTLPLIVKYHKYLRLLNPDKGN